MFAHSHRSRRVCSRGTAHPTPSPQRCGFPAGDRHCKNLKDPVCARHAPAPARRPSSLGREPLGLRGPGRSRRPDLDGSAERRAGLGAGDAQEGRVSLASTPPPSLSPGIFFVSCTAGGTLTTHPWAPPCRIKSVCILWLWRCEGDLAEAEERPFALEYRSLRRVSLPTHHDPIFLCGCLTRMTSELIFSVHSWEM